jgi:23S rRNA (adenine-N6)-dimethyltransferase
VSAQRRTHRDARRRRLGQNFLEPELAREIVAACDVRTDELIVEVGAGVGALTLPLARCGAEVIAVERDPYWAARLRARLGGVASHRVRVVENDFLRVSLPARPFRVVASLPFGVTTEIFRRLFDDPRTPLERADVIVQWEVARKRAASPPSTLLSTTWAPWWEFRLGRRLPASAFRPVPRVDAGLLSAGRRATPLLPPAPARDYAGFVRARWPFAE